ncbi:MAG TPA: potassium transporter Kup [Verrucomicrobiae bacterium]|nr:potassium transporter Kup [Verrucomicrobiae bacterium]
MKSEAPQGRYLVGLMVGALGVVYGDIGTSPLYALRECFNENHGVAPTPANIMGVLSLIFWSLVLVVSVKYLAFVLRADNKGEGGILSLLALAFGDTHIQNRTRASVLLLGIFGAALLYGDGVITPSISVLSAIEGLNVATTRFEHFIIPITILVLVLLFAAQKFGSGRVGKVFGPIMVVWFGALALLGLKGIVQSPGVLAAINPWHALEFILANQWEAFIVMGAVFLVVTGAEALYADLGHFGATPIRRTWFAVVLPALLLNYFGQGALLMTRPSASENPFYLLAPSWALYPLVALSTVATVIASQALISGAFSITMQAIQLGYLPRMEIRHTSSEERGQIYMPLINGILMCCCIGLVLGFETSSNLSAAYGIAVTLTMIITSLLFYFAARRLWQWSRAKAGALCGAFLMLDLMFFAANSVKIEHGGWFPLVAAGAVFLVMTTWKRGRQLLGESLSASLLPFEIFLEGIRSSRAQRVKGTAVFMSGNPNGTPLALLHNLKHNKVLHERVLLLTLVTIDEPHVPAATRVKVEPLADGFWRIVVRVGFMEKPNVPGILAACASQGLPINMEDTTFFLSRESILATAKPGMAIWRERLFAFLARNAQPATAFFSLPANRVVELGMQIEL